MAGISVLEFFTLYLIPDEIMITKTIGKQMYNSTASAKNIKNNIPYKHAKIYE